MKKEWTVSSSPVCHSHSQHLYVLQSDPLSEEQKQLMCVESEQS